MAKALLIVEEALRDLKAHWFEYIGTITSEAEMKGWQVSIACHKHSMPDIVNRFNCFPVFAHAKYLDDAKKKYPGEAYYGFILHSIRTIRVLWPLLKKQPQYDVILAPTVLVHHLIAWFILLNWHPKRPPQTVLLFVTTPSVWNAKEQLSTLPVSSIVIKYLLKLFGRLVQTGKVKLAAETQGAKTQFQQLSGVPFILMPHPVAVSSLKSETSLQATKKQPESYTFGCYGFARYEKGSDILQTAVNKILLSQTSISAHFIIQWTDKFTMPDGSDCEPGEILKAHEKVTLIEHALTTDKYNELLLNTDCMILPYRNSSYHDRVSRVAIEAMTAGIPIIYTKYGWLEEAVTNYGAGIGIEDESPNDLAEAITEILKNKTRYSELAVSQMAEARNYYSPENFCQMLLGDSFL